MENKLYRDEDRKVIGGVCAGLADYFNVDVTLVRLAFVFAMVVLGCGALLYIVLWIVVPPKNSFLHNPMVDYTIPQTPRPAPPFVPVKGRASGVAVAGGTVLILFGVYFLLNQFNLIPDFDFCRFWPVIFIVLGLMLIFSPGKQRHQFAPWDKKDTAPVDETHNDNFTTL